MMGGSPDPPTNIVIFGASGDLTRRKILPALRGVGERVRVLGAGRRPMTRDAFQAEIAEASGSRDLATRADWIQLDYGTPDSYESLRRAIDGDANGNAVVFYLATPPSTFPSILDGLT